MDNQKESKINYLLRSQPPGVVFSSKWLVAQGYSLDLQKQYRKSFWFDSIGTGAMIRHGDQVDYLGGIYALQSQLGLSIHPAGKTSLALQGKAHYLELSAKKAQIFGAKGERLPLWFKKYDWGLTVDCTLTNFLPPDLGLTEIDHKGFTVKVSNPGRAIMECLFLAPKYQPLMEVYELIESLNNLNPVTIQTLLENCHSVKVKRLFLYLVEKAGHDWLEYIALDKIDLGSGKRAIVAGGVYVPKYSITVPKEFEVSE